MDISTRIKNMVGSLSITWWLFIIGLLVRIIHIAFLKEGFYFSDYRAYEETALRLINGEGFDVEVTRPPAYSIFLAIHYFLFGINILPIRIAQAILGATSCSIIFLVTKKVVNLRAAQIAGWISVVYPYYIFVTGLLYPTQITVFFLILSLYCIILSIEQNSLLHFTGATVFLCIAALAVPASLAFSPFLVVWFLGAVRFKWRRKLVFLFLHFIVILATLAPWTIYCYQKTGRIVIIDPRFEKHLPIMSTNKVIRLQSAYIEGGRIGLIRQNPIKFIVNFAGEFIHYWSFVPDRVITRDSDYRMKVYQEDRRMVTESVYTSGFMNFVSVVTYGPIFLLSLISLFLCTNNWRLLSLPLFLILSHAFAYSLFFTQVRYRLPTEFCLFILAGASVAKLISLYQYKYKSH